jgi:hypothetical protein
MYALPSLFLLCSRLTISYTISTTVLQFTEAQLEEFARLNEAAIEKMYDKLKQENIEDYNRRIHQAEVLTMVPPGFL